MEKTIKQLRNRLKKNPADTAALCEMADLLRSQGKCDQAISLVEKHLTSQGC